MTTKIILVSLAIAAIVQVADSQTLEWVKQLGGTSTDFGHSIAVDDFGNIYTTGAFAGTVDFDPGAGTYNLASAGETDIFISKLDASGNFVWAERVGGTGADEAFNVTLDTSGNVYITGIFEGTVDFDPGSGTFQLASAGDHDIFILKLGAWSNFFWAKQMGGAGTDMGYSIAVDASENVYTTGHFAGTSDFDPGAGAFNLTSFGGSDAFISKLDASGNFVWAKQLGGTSYVSGYSITVDALQNVYTTGLFGVTADFDPGLSNFNLTSFGGQDIFISKLDASGNFVWAKQCGGTGSDWGFSIAVDDSENVYITGDFGGTVDFDPGAGTFNLTSTGGKDIFVCKLDASGSFVWAKQMGGTSHEKGFCIEVDASGNVYTTGDFGGTCDFDPGAGTFNLTSSGDHDVFISKLDASGNFVWAKQLGGTNLDRGYSIVVDASDNVYTTGYFLGTSDFDPGAGIFDLSPVGSYDVFVHKMGQVTVDIMENTFNNQFTVYPNPTNGKLKIVFEDELNNVELILRSAIGEEVYRNQYETKNQIELELETTAGIYFIEILTNNKKAVFKVIKE